MVETIEQIKEIAGFLNSVTYNISLDSMLQALNNHECIVTVMGQFSAGKSKLINNLLGKEILPVHITETTAFVTLIKYGENECAEISYADGKEEKISIEDSLALWQLGNNDKMSSIEGIVIYVKNEMLSNGLILVDTPGINTIINKHVELAIQILERSDVVLYVTGKSITDVDIKFIDKIKESGIEIMFIRTHMDDINADEESVEDAINNEKEIFYDLSEHELFFVSNEKENVFFAEIEKVRNYIYNELTSNVNAVLERSCKLKLSHISNNLFEVLSSQQKCFRQLADGKLAEYNSEKEKINITLKHLDELAAKRTARLNKNCADAENDAQEYAAEFVKKAKEKYINQLDKIAIGSQTEVYEETIKEIVSEDYRKMQDIYINSLNKIIGQSREEIAEILSSDLPDYNCASFVPISVEETQEQLMRLELARQQSDTINGEMKQYDQSIKALQTENDEIKEELLVYSERSKSIKNELESFPEYKAQYVIVQEASNAGSAWGARIGNILDWATILIPGKAFTTAAGKGAAGVAKLLTKVGSKSAKVKKAVDVLNKTSKTMLKGKKAIDAAQKADKVLDVAKGAKNVFGEQDDSSPIKILDYLTFEYYFKKIGSKFDKKQIVYVDKDYEKKYNDEKAAIEKKMHESVQDELDKRITVNRNLTEIRRQEMQKNLLKAKQAEAKRELERVKSKIEKERSKTVHTQMCKFYADMGADMINGLYEEIKDKMHEHLPKFVELYTAAENITIMQRLAEQKQKLISLEESFNGTTPEQIQLKLRTYQNYANILKDNIIE